MTEVQSKYTEKKTGYTVQEAANLLGVNRTTLYKNYYRGNIKLEKINNKMQMSLETFEELNKILHSDKAMSVKEFADKNNLSPTTVYVAIRKNNIKPIKNDIVSSKVYSIDDLNKIHEYWQEHHAEAQYFKKNEPKKPNTDKIYNRKTDYTMYTLGQFINAKKPVSNRVVIQWVDYNKVKYSVDINGKIFFTPEQAEVIKNEYRHLPADIECTNIELAKKLHVHPSALILFRKYYKLGGRRVLGYKEFYYTKDEVEEITKMWNNPKISNYPLANLTAAQQKERLAQESK